MGKFVMARGGLLGVLLKCPWVDNTQCCLSARAAT